MHGTVTYFFVVSSREVCCYCVCWLRTDNKAGHCTIHITRRNGRFHYRSSGCGSGVGRFAHCVIVRRWSLSFV